MLILKHASVVCMITFRHVHIIIIGLELQSECLFVTNAVFINTVDAYNNWSDRHVEITLWLPCVFQFDGLIWLLARIPKVEWMKWQGHHKWGTPFSFFSLSFLSPAKMLTRQGINKARVFSAVCSLLWSQLSSRVHRATNKSQKLISLLLVIIVMFLL